VRNFQRCPGCTLVRVADLEPKRLAACSRDWPCVDVTPDALEVTRASDIDAVAIATPIRTHFELALDALRNGKHCLVEKPLACTALQCETLIEEARRRGLSLLVDHTFLYTEAVAWMKQFVSSDRLGDLYYLDFVRTNLGLFQHDASVVWDLAPHDLSVMLEVTGRKPIGVSATGARHAGSRVADIAYLSMDLGDGALAHVHVNWLSPVKVRRIMVAGSQRMLVWDDMEATEKLKIYDSGVSVEQADVDGQPRTLVDYRIGDMTSPALAPREALQTLVQHFLSCIRGEAKPRTGGEAGLEVVRILEAAQHSMEHGGKSIRL
jgi:predicted dehydrogenase